MVKSINSSIPNKAGLASYNSFSFSHISFMLDIFSFLSLSANNKANK